MALQFMEPSFQSYYSGTCNRESDQSHSRAWDAQHWAPAQHCRCGRESCGIGWEVIQSEETDAIMNTLKQYFPSWSLPTPQQGLIHHREDQNGALREYLTPAVVAQLNLVTSKEQAALGYAPYVVADLSSATPCPLLHQRSETEHSPLYVPELSLMICRNPKVATAMIRNVVRSYKVKAKGVRHHTAIPCTFGAAPFFRASPPTPPRPRTRFFG